MERPSLSAMASPARLEFRSWYARAKAQHMLPSWSRSIAPPPALPVVVMKAPSTFSFNLPDGGVKSAFFLRLGTAGTFGSEGHSFFLHSLIHWDGVEDEAVGLRGRRRGPLETLEEFYTRVRGALDLGDRSEERSVRIFVAYLFGHLLFAMRSSQMNCKFVLLLRDLAQAGRYAWGTAMLGHLFSLLPSSSRRSQSTGGFAPFLKIWGYTRFPMGRGVQREGS
ncbi:hypothetical protein Taro_047621 [Colocasia esculenta]|uniref:Aminotransferase-like plant mobile domain-containing protein n=1 Tax=Colocasia esculenta TaxID=4460 RepID=A0A843X1C6_COLES|nr:hypothetical protein [Colocasia esculenta]